ncbi:MAG: hypothetical protein IPG63_08145 [Xanthomonadales bacterium]|nr:hypothetical protein [Xanthomonadales bacterium]MBK7144404.1 hypothetical protein [Xanthomonadales bacterium]
MGSIADAIAWSGSGATLSMFVVSTESSLLDLAALPLEPAPTQTQTYVLDDEDDVLSERRVVEYDLSFRDVPPNIEALITRCLQAARAAGAEVAWFGFEGSFDFGYLLSPEIANQIYAVMDSEGVSLASDETLASDAWVHRIVRAGARGDSTSRSDGFG